jgi:PAS domain S-box-containing protein
MADSQGSDPGAALAPGLAAQSVAGLPLVAKISFAVLFVLALWAGGGLIFVERIVLADFGRIETQLALRNRAALGHVLEAETGFLRSVNTDWAQWDDLYDFTTGTLPEFADEELLNLDLVVILDTLGNPVREDFSRAVGHHSPDVGVVVRNALARARNWNATGQYMTSGLLNTPAGAMILSARPVVHTNGKGAPAGVLVMARRVQADKLSSQLSALPSQVKILDPQQARLPADARFLLDDDTDQNAQLVQLPEVLVDYQLYRDINNQPAFLLESRMPRSILAVGRETIRALGVVAVVAGVLLLVILTFLLRQLVTGRISQLAAHMQGIRQAIGSSSSSEGAKAVLSGPVPGQDQGDEIGDLARDFAALLTARRGEQGKLEQLAAAVQHAGDAIVIMDATGRITYVNPQYEQQTGYRAVDVVGKTPSRGVSGKSQYDELWSTVEAGASWQGVLRSVRRNGMSIEEDTTVTPIANAAGEVVSYVCVLRDVTAKRDAEAEIRKLAAVVEFAADSIMMLDAHGTIEYINPAYERCRGVSLAQVFGKSPAAVGRGLDPMEHYLNVWRTVQGGVTWAGELNTELEDGRILCEQVVVSPVLNADREISHYVSVLHDVTERKKLEQQLGDARRLEAIGQMAAGVAHEVNTPIQYVGDNIQFLKESFGLLMSMVDAVTRLHATGEPVAARDLAAALELAEADYLAAEVPKALAQSIEGVDRVSDIVRSMKELAHPARDFVATDLNRLIRSAVSVAGGQWKSVAEVQMDLLDSLPPVPCQPGSISQVLINMVVNAAQAIADENRRQGRARGTIRLATRQVGGRVEFTVSDNGAGMSAEVKARAFDPFFTTKPVGQGTGQGLAIAFSVVKKHGGEIRLDSAPGQGTTFTVALPLISVEAKSAPEEAAA